MLDHAASPQTKQQTAQIKTDWYDFREYEFDCNVLTVHLITMHMKQKRLSHLPGVDVIHSRQAMTELVAPSEQCPTLALSAPRQFTVSESLSLVESNH